MTAARSQLGPSADVRPLMETVCSERGDVVHAIHIAHHMTPVLGHGQRDSTVEVKLI